MSNKLSSKLKGFRKGCNPFVVAKIRKVGDGK